MSYKIALSSSQGYTEILNVWENSVRNSPRFLSEENVFYIPFYVDVHCKF